MSEIMKSEAPEVRSEKEAVGAPPGKKFSRREFIQLGTAGLSAMLLSGKVKEAAAFLENKINERKEGPRTAIDIFYSPHVTREDVKGIEQKIKEADVFAVEAIGWNEKLLADLSLVSRGETTPTAFMEEHGIDATEEREEFQPFQLTVLNALYKSRKFVTSFDIPKEHPLHKRVVENGKDLEKINYFTQTFLELLHSYRDWIKSFTEIHKEREEYMLRKLEEFQKDLAENKIPELQDKEKVKMCLLIGSAHTRLYHHLKKSKQEVSRTFAVMPHIFGTFTAEAFRRLLFGKKVDDELIARALLWDFLNPVISPGIEQETPSTEVQELQKRKIVEAFSFSEIKNIFEEFKKTAEQNTIPIMRFLDTRFLIERKLREKGITIPSPKEKPKKEEGTGTYRGGW